MRSRSQARFRYLRDRVFLYCVGCYLVILVIRITVGGGAFLNGYANDVLCIGFCLPITLALMRATGFRRHDRMPTALEIAIAVLVWSVMFEIWLPGLEWLPSDHIADPLDFTAYVSGAILASIGWRWQLDLREGRPPGRPGSRKRFLKAICRSLTRNPSPVDPGPAGAGPSHGST